MKYTAAQSVALSSWDFISIYLKGVIIVLSSSQFAFSFEALWYTNNNTDMVSSAWIIMNSLRFNTQMVNVTTMSQLLRGPMKNAHIYTLFDAQRCNVVINQAAMRIAIPLQSHIIFINHKVLVHKSKHSNIWKYEADDFIWMGALLKQDTVVTGIWQTDPQK